MRSRGATWIDSWCRQRVFDRLAHLRAGTISVVEPEASYPFGARVDERIPDAELFVRQPSFYRHVVTGGGLGAAEAYMAGEWSADDLPGLLQLFARDAAACAEIDRSWARRLRLPVERTFAWLRRNTMTGSRKNIAAHYDLSNDFYRLWLDESMAYSSGVFPSDTASLAEAQRHKFDLACQKLQLKPGDHLLEIGTGWGGLAIHAATNYGCHVTTTTISDQQHDYAKEQIALRGLTGRITLLNRDYRELTGQFDKLVSIEMIEAVGHEYLPTFFRACSDRLRAGGLMVLQAITIPDQRYEAYRHSVDFIQRYIFPGGALPCLGAMHRAIADGTRLQVIGLDDYTPHYARTLAAWRERFFDELHEVRRLGFDERFIRMWDYYLSYCIAGFRERQIGLVQLECLKV